MNTVAANVQQLISWNRSMAVALERAENGSQAEDMYFIEKLEKTASVLGFVLDTAPADVTVKPNNKQAKTERLSEPAISSSDFAEYLAEYIDRYEYKAQAGEVGALEEVICEGILAFEKAEGVAVKVVR